MTNQKELRPEYRANGNLHIAVIEFSYKEKSPGSKTMYESIVRETAEEIDADLANIAHMAGHFQVHRRYEGINQDGRREITGVLDKAKLKGKALDLESLDAALFMQPSKSRTSSVSVIKVG